MNTFSPQDREALDILESVERKQWTSADFGGRCLWCGGDETAGHTKDCELMAVLAHLREARRRGDK